MTVRLGDTIDDFCVKCKRLTNHHVVSILDDEPAKVRCCSCYHDHDYRHEEPEPKKLTKKQLEEQDKKAKEGAPDDAEDADAEDVEDEEEDDTEISEDDFAVDDDEEDRPAPKRGRR